LSYLILSYLTSSYLITQNHHTNLYGVDVAAVAAVHHIDDGHFHGQEEVHEEGAQDRSILRLAHVIRLGIPPVNDGEELTVSCHIMS
jgi:hypothetical protein